MLYLDNAATSYRKPFRVYYSVLKNTWKNSVNAGHGGHDYSLRGSAEILKTSEKLADLFHIQNPERIAYCQNATQGLNMAIGGILQSGGHAVVTQMEHNSVLRPVHHYGNYTVVPADKFGRVSPMAIEAAIRPDTALIVCTHISNVSGTVQPIAKIGQIAKKHGIPFLVDAAQSAGCAEIDVEKMHIDMLAFSGHKGLLAPLGTGGLYVAEHIRLKPVYFGGTGSYSELLTQPEEMPDFLQSGTLNTPGILALGAGVDYIRTVTAAGIGYQERRLAQHLIEKLLNMDAVKVYGFTGGTERNGTIAFNVGEHSSVETAQILNDEFKICTRGGWHCAYGAHTALGTEEQGAVRASFGAFDSMHAVNRLADAVWKIAKR